jgi:lipoprotein-anchoring transpeptidase ErfK/SrfK
MQLKRVFSRITRGIPVLLCATLFADTRDKDSATEPAKSARELIQKQEPPVIAADLADKITPENSRIVLSLGKQRAYLKLGDQTYIDSPISAGRRAGVTPTGSFSVLAKDLDYRSTTYGNFVDKQGRVVRSGVCIRSDSAPSGTQYIGAPMKYFCRLNEAGIGLHAGILPGYPASTGCIRLPEDMAKVFFEKVKVGTPVEILAE